MPSTFDGGSAVLDNYRFYTLDSFDHIVGSQNYEFGDDAAAMEKARALSESSGIEVWKDSRLIGRLKKK